MGHARNDRVIAKARELNSRWLEEINSNPSALPGPSAKYEVRKAIEPANARATPLLAA